MKIFLKSLKFFLQKNINLLPIFFTVNIIPLLIRYNNYVNDSSKIYFSNGGEIFSFVKAKAIILVALVEISLLTTNIFKSKNNTNSFISQNGEKIKDNFIKNFFLIFKLFYPLFLYAILIILSSLNSKYKDVAFFGLYERNEGMFVLLSYLVFFFYAFFKIKNFNQIKIIFFMFYFLILIFAMIGFFQFIGKDIFISKFFKYIIYSKSVRNFLTTKNNFNKNIYLTLYNPNYVGSFACIGFGLSLTLFVNSIKNKEKMFHGFFVILSFFILVGSYSRGGYLGGFVIGIIVLVIFVKIIFKYWLQNFILLFILASIFVFMNYYKNDKIFKRITNEIDQFESIIIEKQEKKIKNLDIKIEKNKIFIENNSTKLIVERINEKFSFLNEKEQEIKLSENSLPYKIKFDDVEYNDYKIELKKFDVINIKNSNFNINFKYTENKFKILTPYNLTTDISYPKIISFFNGKESLFTNRGYIWGLTIPILSNTFFIGNGPDTFIFYFPQDDYVGKIKTFNKPYIIIDKPHNFYLQVAHNTGILSLILIIINILIYILDSLKIYIKKSNSINIYNMAIVISILGYLVTCIVNDSVVGVAPLFWTLLGIGYFINNLDKKNFSK